VERGPDGRKRASDQQFACSATEYGIDATDADDVESLRKKRLARAPLPHTSSKRVTLFVSDVFQPAPGDAKVSVNA
jgi:hypothetical protein